MPAISPLISNWAENNLKWKYVFSPYLKAFKLEPNQMMKVPVQGEHAYPEGLILTGGALFDSPMCGIRFFAEPTLDTKTTFTIVAFSLWGLFVPAPTALSVAVPPDTPDGSYAIHLNVDVAWEDNFAFYVFNIDTVEHWCLGLGYTLAVLDKERPTPKDVRQLMADGQKAIVDAIGVLRRL